MSIVVNEKTASKRPAFRRIVVIDIEQGQVVEHGIDDGRRYLWLMLDENNRVRMARYAQQAPGQLDAWYFIGPNVPVVVRSSLRLIVGWAGREATKEHRVILAVDERDVLQHVRAYAYGSWFTVEGVSYAGQEA